MAQSAEAIKNNIIKIMDREGNNVGTGFFIQQGICVTCHHNIWTLDKIFVSRIPTQKYEASWIDELSDPKKDIAVLKIDNSPFIALECAKATFPGIEVVVRGYPIEDEGHLLAGKEIKGKPNDATPFWWQDEGRSGQQKWNVKPEVNVSVFPFEGDFSVGYSGAPVCFQHDWKVVGMFEATDNTSGYVIGIEEILERINNQPKVRDVLSDPKETLDAGVIIDDGNLNYKNGEYLKAIWTYDKILNDGNYVIALNNKGLALYNLGQYDEANKLFDKALEINPYYVSAWYGKGLILEISKQYEEAIKCYDKALEIDPKYEDAWNNKGANSGDLGQYEEAIKCFDKVLEINPNNTAAWINKGICLYNLQQYEEAIKCYDKALEEVDPSSNASAWYYKGLSLSAQKKETDAEESFGKARDLGYRE